MATIALGTIPMVQVTEVTVNRTLILGILTILLTTDPTTAEITEHAGVIVIGIATMTATAEITIGIAIITGIRTMIGIEIITTIIIPTGETITNPNHANIPRP